ncbi:GNAT family protein [Intrasporangium sp.]|uniref:GNAT family N-acetyltransferase n=1 Tax=Intrasporangium sp. TaxID=1925024 RepID=UPI003221D36B
MTDLADVWPVHAIRLRTAGLDLQVMREADLPAVVGALPDDVELDPGAPSYPGLGRAANRRAALARSYWRALGTWSPDDWALPFVVRERGEVVGVQWLEGPAPYRRQRTVDSSSWLVPRARRRGLGTQMRAAVLELAFGHLGAVAAITSAYVENAASLGVSRALGYRETHTSVLEPGSRVLQHLRLDRPDWPAGGPARPVDVSGVAGALALFALGDERAPGDERV